MPEVNPLFDAGAIDKLLGAPEVSPAPATPAPPTAAPAVKPVAGETKPMSWAEVPEKAIEHLPESAAGVVKSMVAPIAHPIETAQALGSLGAGLYSKAAGAMGAEQKPEEKAAKEAPLNAVIDFYKQRYGTEEGLKKALAEDPAGVMTDLSVFLTGGGSLAAKAPGMVGKAGELALQAGRMEPITATAAKAVETVAKPITAAVTAPTSALFSFTTGKPIKTFQDAARAGYAHNPEFIKHFSGEGNAEDIVNRVQGALDTIANKRSSDYIAGMKDPLQSQKPLDYQNVDKALAQAEPKFKHLGKVFNQEAENAYNEALAKIDQWKSQPAQAGANNIEDFDKLKRAIDEVHYKYSREFGAESPAARVVSDIRRSVFDTIKAEDPRYADVMERYAQSTQKMNEIRKELVGGKTTTIGAKMRKLLKSRDNAHKGELLAELEAIDPDIGYALAGHDLGSLLPQGMVGKIMAGLLPTAAGAATFSPGALLAAGAASPMLTGAVQYGAGAIGGLPAKVSPKIPYFAGEMRERQGRASGGKVNRGMTVQGLISAVEAAKKINQQTTEKILSAPDESVVKALKIANDHI